MATTGTGEGIVMSAKGYDKIVGMETISCPSLIKESLLELEQRSRQIWDKTEPAAAYEQIRKEGKERYSPNGMKLVCYLCGLCTFSDKGLDFLELAVVSSLESGRVVEDELRVALEAERATDVMDPTLITSGIRTPTPMSKSTIRYPFVWL